MTASRPAISQLLLRAHRDASAPTRERWGARLFVAATVAALTMVIAFAAPTQGADVVAKLPAYVPAIAYHVVLLVVLRRGWFHRAVPWVSMIVQTSMLAGPFYLTGRDGGTQFFAGNAMTLGWFLIVFTTALRAKPALSIVAGVIAGIEHAGIALALAGDELAGAQRAYVITASAMLVLAGAIAAFIARYLVAQAEAALHAVREQDLMNKYFIHERLGVGGMAEVFRATYSPEGGFEKIVAIKRVLPDIVSAGDGEMFLAMFREEARLCARLSHPNVIQVFDAGLFRGSYVLAMEYVDGVSLQRVIRDAGEPLPASAVVFVAAELAAALDYIHARVDADGKSLHLVHRDLNPPNVLVSRIGEVKLADFGVAHAIDRASLRADRVYGKPGYIAPEQLDDVALDGRADLFLLGLVMYEMIVGTPMFRGASLDQVAEFRIPEAELANAPRAAKIPAELRAIVIALLAHRRDDRPRSAADVRGRLLALGGAAAAFPAGQAEVARLVAIARERPAATAAETAATVVAR